MSTDFNKYKKQLKMTKAYEKAGEIQEALALSMCPASGKNSEKQYEGHIAVSDVLNKIDAMVRMFERSLQDNDDQDSSAKIIEVICNLYDLAQIKMAEAKKQAKSYMEKAAGVSVDSVDDLGEPEEFPDDAEIIGDEEPGNNDGKEIAFKTRGPMEPPTDEIEPSAVPPEPIGGEEL